MAVFKNEKLVKLCATGNRIKILRKEIGNLKSLNILNLDYNDLERIPDRVKYF